MRLRARQLRPKPQLMARTVPIAPFYYQPTRQGLQGLHALGAGAPSGYAPPVGAGAGAGATTGASQGAAIGTAIVPGIGTAIGAVVGAIGGAIAGALGKKDPEQYNFDQAVAIWQQSPDAVYQIGNKYLPLAGLFDLNITTNIPIYKKFGHMGEEKFVAALVNLLYNAAINGQITSNDTALSVMSRVVQPWIDSWGYGPMSDPHADLITRLIIGMIIDYVDGGWKQAWRARSGDVPASFTNLPNFPTLGAAPAAASAAAPTPYVAPTSSSTAAQPGAPSIINTADGSVAVPGQGVGLKTAAGQTFWLGNPLNAGGYAILITDPARGWNAVITNNQQGSGVRLQLANGGQLYTQNAQGAWSLWDGNQFNASGPPPAPAGSAVMPALPPTTPATPVIVSPPATVPQNTAPVSASNPTVATTSTGQAVTQADLQALVGQIASQGATAQQAYTAALQTLANNGVQASAPVQSAVQQAIAATPPPATTAGVDLSALGDSSWLGIALIGATLLFATARPAGRPQRRRRARR